MNILRILLIIFTCFIYTQSFADIIFEIAHKSHPSYQGLSLDFQPSLEIKVEKTNHAHSARSPWLLPEKDYRDYTRSTWLFAPDPTGEYIITVRCYNLTAVSKEGKVFTFGNKKISVPHDGSSVRIEAVCPVIKDNQGYFQDLGIPEASIIVDKDYVIGTLESTMPVDFAHHGNWHYEYNNQDEEFEILSTNIKEIGQS
jgi:hypothetical protein